MFEVFFCSISFTDCYGKKYNTILTRLHSSRMRTARALTVSPSMLAGGGGGEGVSARVGYLLWGVSAPRGCLLLGGCLLGGVCLLRGGCVCSQGGLSAPGGMAALGGVSSGGSAPMGVSAPGGCVCSGGCLAVGVYPSMH